MIKKIKYRSIIVTDFKVCIISIGTIDIANLEYHVFLPRYSELLFTIRRKNPNIDIIICAILPRPADHEISKPMVARVNFLLEDLCSKRTYLHFNKTYKGFLTFNQPISELFAPDGLNLGRLGLLKVSQIMKTLVSLWRRRRLTFN